MLETKRLIIKPLDHSQLLKFLENNNSLEKELSLNRVTKSISPELKDALENTLIPNVADKSKNYLFSTLWVMIDKIDMVMVGSLCFCGEPNQKKEIEVGCGTFKEFEGRGFMTEALAGLVSWASTIEEIDFIVASTNKENKASCSILKKNNFLNIAEDKNLLHWKLSL